MGTRIHYSSKKSDTIEKYCTKNRIKYIVYPIWTENKRNRLYCLVTCHIDK